MLDTLVVNKGDLQIISVAHILNYTQLYLTPNKANTKEIDTLYYQEIKSLIFKKSHITIHGKITRWLKTRQNDVLP